MHADQDEHHPWLRDENFFLQRLLGLRVPTLGVCLGAQLLAKAAHAPVHRGRARDRLVRGRADGRGGDDPVFAELPERFAAFQWHYYTYDVPAGGGRAGGSRVCTQAFRLGE